MVDAQAIVAFQGAVLIVPEAVAVGFRVQGAEGVDALLGASVGIWLDSINGTGCTVEIKAQK